MLVCDYIVERIDGDYAMLKRTNLPEEEAKVVARALLPEEIREGSRLHYELLQYTIVEYVCALGLESAGAHFFQSVIFCLEIFQKILRKMDVHI